MSFTDVFTQIAARLLLEASWVLNSIRNRQLNLILLRSLQAYGYQGFTAVTADSLHEASSLRNLGAHLVLTRMALI